MLAAVANVVAYDKTVINVCLVQFNNTSTFDAASVERELNTMYAPAIVVWKVRSIKLDIETIEKVSITPTDGSMSYTDDEKQIMIKKELK